MGISGYIYMSFIEHIGLKQQTWPKGSKITELLRLDSLLIRHNGIGRTFIGYHLRAVRVGRLTGVRDVDEVEAHTNLQ